VVDRRRLLGQPGGVPERVAADQDADPDPIGAGGESREQGPGLEVRAGRAAGLDPVVAVPNAVEAELLEPPPALDGLLPGQVLVRADAEAKGLDETIMAR
jgi:hypothetical protein